MLEYSKAQLSFKSCWAKPYLIKPLALGDYFVLHGFFRPIFFHILFLEFVVFNNSHN